MCLSAAHGCFIMTQSDFSRLRRVGRGYFGAGVAEALSGWKPWLFPPEHLEFSSIFTEETVFVVNLAKVWSASPVPSVATDLVIEIRGER